MNLHILARFPPKGVSERVSVRETETERANRNVINYNLSTQSNRQANLYLSNSVVKEGECATGDTRCTMGEMG